MLKPLYYKLQAVYLQQGVMKELKEYYMKVLFGSLPRPDSQRLTDPPKISNIMCPHFHLPPLPTQASPWKHLELSKESVHSVTFWSLFFQAKYKFHPPSSPNVSSCLSWSQSQVNSLYSFTDHLPLRIRHLFMRQILPSNAEEGNLTSWQEIQQKFSAHTNIRLLHCST